MTRTKFDGIDPAKFFNKGEPLPYIGISARGTAGSGKSYTLGMIALGIWKDAQCKNGIVVVDTEQSLKFLRPLFVESGIREADPADPDNQLYICSTNPETGENPTFADLCRLLDWMDAGNADIMLVDSITKIHRDFIESFRLKKYGKAHKGKIQFADWPIVNQSWRGDLTERLVHGRGHKLISGRLGDVYEFVDIGEDKKKELVRTGHKIAADKEMDYELDINFEMRKVEELNRTGSGGKKLPDRVYRTATVLKSRFPRLDGKTINASGKLKGPKYEDFREAICFVIGDPAKRQEHKVERTSNQMILEGVDDDDTIRSKNIGWQRFKAELDGYLSYAPAGAKNIAATNLLTKLFDGETSLDAIRNLNADRHQSATGQIRRIIKRLVLNVVEIDSSGKLKLCPMDEIDKQRYETEGKLSPSLFD